MGSQNSYTTVNLYWMIIQQEHRSHIFDFLAWDILHFLHAGLENKIF